VILEHANITEAEAWERSKQQLELVGIGSARAKNYPHEFSGGMKQRVMIAIATACAPELLIMDEPVTGLDVIVQRQLLTLTNDLRAKMHLPIIFITHDLSVIAETCDKVAVMYAGKIVEQGSTVSLYKEPIHPYSKALINSYPSVKGEKRELKSIPGAPPRLIDPPAGCRFHPRCEYVMDICRTEEPPLENRNNGRLVACHLIK
jgi:peptide/nickel transport system ATP-binding protein